MSGRCIDFKKTIIYGPVNSRRLGQSLGVNLLPTRYKACPFNCVYCQYGHTTPMGFLVETSGTDMPTPGEVLAALEEGLRNHPEPDYITFSGNGEPTLHPRFPDILREVGAVRNRLAPGAKLALLTNGAFLSNPGVRDALSLLDVTFLKLDAGDERTFQRYNRPHREIRFPELVSLFKTLDPIVIQTLFSGGKTGNTDEGALKAWMEKIGEIRPVECQIYSLDRPSEDRRLIKLTKSQLLDIKDKTEAKTAIPVRVFHREESWKQT